MPSPISHMLIGYVIYRITRMPQQEVRLTGPLPLPRLLVITVGLSLLPDIDSIPGVLTGEFGRFHNNLTHSPFVGLIVALSFGGIVWLKEHARFLRWVLLVLLCYELHVIMDFFTFGRGVMLLWPFSPARYAPPMYLFYGLHWSEGWVSVKHIWTVVTELAFVMFVIFVMYLFSKAKMVNNRSGGQECG